MLLKLTSFKSLRRSSLSTVELQQDQLIGLNTASQFCKRRDGVCQHTLKQFLKKFLRSCDSRCSTFIPVNLRNLFGSISNLYTHIHNNSNVFFESSIFHYRNHTILSWCFVVITFVLDTIPFQQVTEIACIFLCTPFFLSHSKVIGPQLFIKDGCHSYI